MLHLVEQLQAGERPGDKIPGVGSDVYKVRLPNGSARKGKSGGFRVIYFVQVADRVYLLTLYPKTKQENIAPLAVRALVDAIIPPEQKNDQE